jgi:hypothetical protein
LASKSIRKETLPILYRGKWHYLHITAARLPNVLLWLHQVAANFDRIGMRTLLRSLIVTVGFESSHRVSKPAMFAAAQITRFACRNAICLDGHAMSFQDGVTRQLAPVVIARAPGYLAMHKRWTDEVLEKHIAFAHNSINYLPRGPPSTSQHRYVTAAMVILEDGKSIGFAYLPNSPDYTGHVDPAYYESYFVIRCASKMFLICKPWNVYFGSLHAPNIETCYLEYCAEKDCWHRRWKKFAEKPLEALANASG